MPQYFAIASQNGEWVYLCAGPDTEEVYREAITLIEEQEAADDDETLAFSPVVESMLNSLRVVPEESARATYHVTFPSWVQADE